MHITDFVRWVLNVFHIFLFLCSGVSTASPMSTVSVDQKAPSRLLGYTAANGGDDLDATPKSWVTYSVHRILLNIYIHVGSQYRVIILPKKEIDKANKDKKHKHFPSNFKVIQNMAYCKQPDSMNRYANR